jgi:hypothetical protein
MIPILIIVASIATVLFPIGFLTLAAVVNKDAATINGVFLVTISLTITSLACWMLVLWFGIHELIHPHQPEACRDVITVPTLD